MWVTLSKDPRSLVILKWLPFWYGIGNVGIFEMVVKIESIHQQMSLEASKFGR
jgi:hypothetical protein